MTDSLEPYLTPPEIAKLLRVSLEKVVGWIRKAELKAINISEGYRPRYRIRREDLDLFLRSREVQPPATRVPTPFGRCPAPIDWETAPAFQDARERTRVA